MKIIEVFKSKLKTMYDTGALHITIGTFLTKFVAFFGSIVVVRLLSKEDYGVMNYAENIYSYVLVFAALGMSNAILRYLIVADNPAEKRQYFNYIINRSVIINIILSVLLIAISQMMPIPDKFAAARHLIPILALLLPFQDLLSDGLFSIRAFFRNKLYAYLAFISSSVLIAGRVAGAKVAGVEGVLWSRVLINMVFAVSIILYVKRTLISQEKTIGLSEDKRKTVNSYSLQYMITNGFWAIFMLNDKFLLGMLLNDPAGLADYNVASVFPGNISIFATAIGIFVGPFFTKNENNLEWIRRNYRKVAITTAGVVGFVALSIALLAKPLINLVYGQQYLNIVGLMKILLFSAFLNAGLRFTPANLLAAMGEIKYNMIVSGAGIGLQIFLDLILIPKMGVIGVAISNCIVFFLMAAALFTVFHKKYFQKGIC